MTDEEVGGGLHRVLLDALQLEVVWFSGKCPSCGDVKALPSANAKDGCRSFGVVSQKDPSNLEKGISGSSGFSDNLFGRVRYTDGHKSLCSCRSSAMGQGMV